MLSVLCTDNLPVNSTAAEAAVEAAEVVVVNTWLLMSYTYSLPASHPKRNIIIMITVKITTTRTKQSVEFENVKYLGRVALHFQLFNGDRSKKQ